MNCGRSSSRCCRSRAPKLVEGRPRVPDRQALCGILFVLHTGIQWEYLPQELGFGSGMTCWRRLAAWNEAGVWDRLHVVLLTKLRGREAAGLVAGGDRLLPRPGRSAGPKSGPSPVDRARPGSKHHVLTDGQGIPLAVVADRRQPQRRHPAAAAARQDPARRAAGVGRPRRRPDALLADRGYDHDKYRRLRLGARASDPSSPAAAAARLRPGHPPLGRRAHHRLAARLPPPAHPLGTTRRHPRSLPRPRHLPHHPPPRPTPLLLTFPFSCRG